MVTGYASLKLRVGGSFECGLVMALGSRGQKFGVSVAIGELRVVCWWLVEKYGGGSSVLQRFRGLEVIAGCLLAGSALTILVLGWRWCASPMLGS